MRWRLLVSTVVLAACGSDGQAVSGRQADAFNECKRQVEVRLGGPRGVEWERPRFDGAGEKSITVESQVTYDSGDFRLPSDYLCTVQREDGGWTVKDVRVRLYDP